MTDLHITPVPKTHIPTFRELVYDYWFELMRTASRLKDEASRSAYFTDRFHWDDDHVPPYWAVRDGQPIGFVHFRVSDRRAQVADFYVCPEVRRQGVGRQLVRWLLAHLDALSVTEIELSARRDNPGSLAFWESQGFMIGHHQLLMHRDPDSGTAYKGALSSDFDEADLGFEPWKVR